MLAAFPDLAFTFEATVERGDLVANRSTMRGTQAAEFLGLPSTGRSFEVTLLDMVRVVDGKVAEHWALLDQAALEAH